MATSSSTEWRRTARRPGAQHAWRQARDGQQQNPAEPTKRAPGSATRPRSPAGAVEGDQADDGDHQAAKGQQQRRVQARTLQPARQLREAIEQGAFTVRLRCRLWRRIGLTAQPGIEGSCAPAAPPRPSAAAVLPAPPPAMRRASAGVKQMNRARWRSAFGVADARVPASVVRENFSTACRSCRRWCREAVAAAVPAVVAIDGTAIPASTASRAGLDDHVAGRRRRRRRNALGAHPSCVARSRCGSSRTPRLPSVANGVGELQRRHHPVALADAGDHRLAQGTRARFMARFQLARGSRRCLAGQVDAGRLAEAELAQC